MDGCLCERKIGTSLLRRNFPLQWHQRKCITSCELRQKARRSCVRHDCEAQKAVKFLRCLVGTNKSVLGEKRDGSRDHHGYNHCCRDSACNAMPPAKFPYSVDRAARRPRYWHVVNVPSQI